jgi:hypothetical protein
LGATPYCFIIGVASSLIVIPDFRHGLTAK